MPKAPSYQIEEALKNVLQTNISAVSSAQIRRVLDLSGADKGTAGVVISVADNGGFSAAATRTVISCTAEVVCYTHLEDDLDGEVFDSLVSQALIALQGATYVLEGWRVALPSGYGSWSVARTGTDGSFRQAALTATVHLHQYTLNTPN